MLSSFFLASGLASLTAAAPHIGHGWSSAGYSPAGSLPVLNSSTCIGITYINRGLVAYGSIASDARDSFGDTLGGFGSAAAPDVSSFQLLKNGSIRGTIFAVPDRGWNTEGSVDYQSRIHKFQLTFNPTFGSIANGSQNLNLGYEDTTLFFKGDSPTTGLDADYVIPASDGFPDLPAGKTDGNGTVPAIDQEGLIRLRDGSYWISDEYGPYIYHFTEQGQMTTAIRPPQSFVPYRDGELSFSSGNPPVGSDIEEADDPDNGRANNHGFEGLAISTVSHSVHCTRNKKLTVYRMSAT